MTARKKESAEGGPHRADPGFVEGYSSAAGQPAGLPEEVQPAVGLPEEGLPVEPEDTPQVEPLPPTPVVAPPAPVPAVVICKVCGAKEPPNAVICRNCSRPVS